MKEKLKNVQIPATHKLWSADVESMYTNIPKSEAIRLAGNLLEADETLKDRTPLKPDDIIRLLKLDLELAYFRYDGKYYDQPNGLGMGKSTSSPLADIVMERFLPTSLTTTPSNFG